LKAIGINIEIIIDIIIIITIGMLPPEMQVAETR